MRILRPVKSPLGNKFFASLCGAVIVLLAGVVVNAAVNYGVVYPTQETQSSFLKRYLPVSVIEQFDEYRAPSRNEISGARAGRGSATHTKVMDFHFVTRPETAPLIVKALRDNAAISLQGSKMRVVDQSDIPGGGHTFRYAGAATQGILTIEPVVVDEAVHRRMPLPSGIQDMKAEIRIEEKWLKEIPR